jgi:hypothetical protein
MIEKTNYDWKNMFHNRTDCSIQQQLPKVQFMSVDAPSHHHSADGREFNILEQHVYDFVTSGAFVQ